MWATFALAAALSCVPGQSGPLQLTNDRMTYGGYNGVPRPSDKVLPGDVVFIPFDIENLKVNASGKVYYSMALQFLNNKSEPQFTSEAEDREALVALGGNRIPAIANIDVGKSTAPGRYTIKVTVTDQRTKEKRVLQRNFEVLPPDFGLVRVYTSFGHPAIPAPSLLIVGQAIVVNGSVIGFQRDAKTKQPDVLVEMRVLDEAGKPTLAKPITWELLEEKMNVPAVEIPFGHFGLPLNRPGKFSVELKATDRLANKTSTVSLPFQVQEVK